MRSLFWALALGLILMAFAGCVAQQGPGPGDEGTPQPSPSPEPERHDLGDVPVVTPPPEPPSDDQTFCASADDCDFWDDLYHEYVLYEMDTPTIDVLIIPSGSANAVEDTDTMRAAVQAWGDGISSLGAEWLASGLVLNTYVIGEDVPPQDALDDPEIIVVGAEYNPFLLFGIGLQSPFDVCRERGGAVKEMPLHAHHGMQLKVAECAEGGHTCVALNTNFLLGGAHRLYDLVAHEFGHCLGVGHVGDAMDFSAKRVPVDDIMSYQHDPGQVHCVSNLNVRTIEGIYGPLLGRKASGSLRPGDFVTMDPTEYEQVTCTNPAA